VNSSCRYKQSFRSFGHVRAARPAPPPPPPPPPPAPGDALAPAHPLQLDLPAPEEEEFDLRSMSALPSPVREETDLPRQAHTGPLTRKEGLADYGKDDIKCRPILFCYFYLFILNIKKIFNRGSCCRRRTDCGILIT
jgi:hypothetical protein